MRHAGPLLALTPLLAALALAACGGSEKPPSGASADSTGAPPAAPVEPTVRAFPSLLEVTPVAPRQPATPRDALLGGTPNRRAAAMVRDQLKAAGLDLPGLEVYVLPVSGTHEEILVVEIDASAAGAAGTSASETASDDPEPFFKALASVANSEIANVTRVVFNLHGEENGVPSIVTLVFPMAAISDAALGIQSSGDLLEQLQFEIRPEAAP